MQDAVRHFACTMCGKCCNRSPEVELSEAAALADVFVFRLMFRLYALPRSPRAGESTELFYQKKRLLAVHAVHKRPVKVRRGENAVDYVQYLTISALSLDTRTGACSALQDDGRCGIHPRRPYSCRTVPFHYSRVEASAERDLDAFVATEGYGCDTGERAPVVMRAGRITDADALRDRAEALGLSEGDARWRGAIVRRMRSDDALPTLDQVAARASVGPLTSSMRVAWQIAADAGLMSQQECRALIAAQLATIELTLRSASQPQEAQSTLREMALEYRQALGVP